MKVFIILSLVCLAVPALGIDCSNCTGGCELEIQTCGTEARPCPPCAAECDKCTLIDNVGYLADPFDCRRFYQCMKDADNEWVVSEARWCADCTQWDADLCTCSWADCSDCANGRLFLSYDDGENWVEYKDGESVGAGYTDSLFTSGATWQVGGNGVAGSVNEIDSSTGNVAGVANRTLTPFVSGTPDGFTTNWTLCFANCTYGSDGQLTPAASEGSQYRYKYYAENNKPENWCDEECSVIREVRDCSTPEPCPTPNVDDCPCMIHLAFEDNLLDSVWNVSVIEHGNVTFDDDCNGRAGVFDESSLQIDFFNNYFNDNGYEFTVYFCINPDGPGTIMTNGCDDSLVGGVAPTFSIWYDGTRVTVNMAIDGDCDATVEAEYTGAGDCQCFLAYWDGGVLTLHSDGCTASATPIIDDHCDGSIRNTKCALTIGSDNHGPTSSDQDYFVGIIDDVTFCRTGDPLNVDLPADCPCP